MRIQTSNIAKYKKGTEVSSIPNYDLQILN